MPEDNQIVIDDDSDEEEIVEEECPDCGKVFTDLNELASHYFSAHEAAKRATKKTENSSAAKTSQNVTTTTNQTTAFKPPAASSAFSSSSPSQNTVSAKTQISTTGVKQSIVPPKVSDVAVKQVISGSPNGMGNKDVIQQNNPSKIPQGKVHEQPKVFSEGQIKIQPNQLPQAQGQGRGKPQVTNQGQPKTPQVIQASKTSQPSVQSQIKVQSQSTKTNQIQQPIKSISNDQIKDSNQVIANPPINSASPMAGKPTENEVLNANNEHKVDVDPNSDAQEETYTDLLVQYFKENDLPFMPRVRNKSDGNCWYEAIADQVVLHAIKDMPTTHEAMRKAICDALFTLPQTKSWIKNLFGGQKKRFVNFVNKHRKNGEWTDAKGLICQATALMLKRNIHIVGTANKGQSVCYTKLESVEEAEKFPALTVGYYQDQHYHSIQKVAAAGGVKKEEDTSAVKVDANVNKETVAANKADETVRMGGGKVARTPIAAKPLRKVPVEKTDDKVQSTTSKVDSKVNSIEAIPPTKVNSTEVIPPVKGEGKTAREPIAAKPLRKIPTDSNAANEKSDDSKESKTDAGKIERTPIVSKPLRKAPVENSASQTNANQDPKTVSNATAIKQQNANKVDSGKIQRQPIATKPIRKDNSSVENKGDKKLEPTIGMKAAKEQTIVPNPLQKVSDHSSNQTNQSKLIKPTINSAAIQEKTQLKPQNASKFDGKVPRPPIATKPIRKESSNVTTNKGDQKTEPSFEMKPKVPPTSISSKETALKPQEKTNRNSNLAQTNIPKKDGIPMNKKDDKPNVVTIDVDSFEESATKEKLVKPIPMKPNTNNISNNDPKDKSMKPNVGATTNNSSQEKLMKQNQSLNNSSQSKLCKTNPGVLTNPNSNKNVLTKPNPSVPSSSIGKQTPNLPAQGSINKNPNVSNVNKPVQGKIISNNYAKPTQAKAQNTILKPSKFSLAARNKLLRNSAIKIQRWFRNIRRGRKVQAEFQKKKSAAIVFQKHWRSVLARKKVGKMKATLKIEAWYAKRQAKKTKAAISIQSRWKSVKSRKQYLAKKKAVITVQKHCRTLLAKRLASNLRKSKGALKIQKWFRNVKEGKIARKDFLRKKRAALTIQPHWRSYLAQCRGPSFQLNTPDEHIINPETGEVELADEYVINPETGNLEKTPVDLGDYVNKMTEPMDWGTLSKMTIKTWKKAKLKNSLISSLKGANPRKSLPEMAHYEASPPLFLTTTKPVENLSYEEDFEIEDEMHYNDEKTFCKDQDYLGQSVSIFTSFLSPLTRRPKPECFVKAEKAEIVEGVLNHILDAVFPSAQLDESFKYSEWRINAPNQQKSWFEIQVEAKEAKDKSRAILTMQSHWRGFVVRRSFLKVKNAAIRIQSWFKNIRNTRILRETYVKKKKASVVLQSHIRSFLQRKKFIELKKAATLIQSKRKMILQKRTFDELKSATITIQKWYKDLRCKAFLLYNPEVTSIEKNLKEYVEESADYVSFNKIHEIAIENRAGFKIRTKVFSKFQPQILEHRKNETIKFVEENIDSDKDDKVSTLDGLIIVPEQATDTISKKENLDTDIDENNAEYLEESKALPSFDIFNHLPQKETKAANKRTNSKKRGAARNTENRKIAVQTLESILDKVCTQESFLKTLSISEEIDFFNVVQIEKERKAKYKMFRYTSEEMYDEQESNCIDQFISARKEFITSRNAPTKIQRWLRNIKAGRVLRKDFLRKRKAATTIQAYRRSLVTRREFQTMKEKTSNAATLLQANWRSLVTRRLFSKKKEAAVQIQGWFRIMTVRKVLRKDFIQKKAAVKTIQSYWRAVVAKRKLVKTKAATAIQASWRAFVATRAFARMKESTIKIQRWFRNIQEGRSIRKRFLEKKKSSIMIQAQWRGLVARKKWDNHKFSKSIVNRLIEEAVRQNRAATLLQSVWRSWVVRKKFLVEKKSVINAVTTIQSQWKMLVARKQFLKVKEASVKIQKWRRNLRIGEKKRKEFVTMKKCAVVLQSHWRGLLGRRKCKALRTVNSVICELMEAAAFPRSVVEEIMDEAVGNALIPRENVEGILNVILADIFRPKVPVKSTKNHGKPASKKRTAMPKSLKRKLGIIEDEPEEIEAKRKKDQKASKKGDLEDLYFAGSSTDSVLKEVEFEEIKRKTMDIISKNDDEDTGVKRKRKDSIPNEDIDDIVVVGEVKRRQTDFMVQDVALPSKGTTNHFDAVSFEQTLSNIKETLNIIKDLPANNSIKDPVLENIKEDPDIIEEPDIVEICAPTGQSSTKALGIDINVVEMIFKCPECFSSFNISSEYQTHITTVCSVVKAEPVVKVEPELIEELRCNLCEATFNDENGMEIHRTFFHGGRELQSENKSVNRNSPVKSKSNETGFETSNLENLFKNIEQKIKSAKTVPQPAIASQVVPKEVFSSSEDLKLNPTNPSIDMSKKEETPIQITKCDECGKLRKRKETKKAALVWLLNHRKECSALTNSKPFKCMQCPSSFSSNAALSAHKKMCRPNNENVKNEAKPVLEAVKPNEPIGDSQKKLQEHLANRLKQIEMYEVKEKQLMKKRKIPRGDGLSDNGKEKRKYNKKIKLDNNIVENIRFVQDK